jgi:hypothetical protein
MVLRGQRRVGAALWQRLLRLRQGLPRLRRGLLGQRQGLPRLRQGLLRQRQGLLRQRSVDDEDRGAVAVLVAILTVALLIPIAAIVIDLGYLRSRRDQAQTAADAAALAVAQDLKAGADPADARANAAEYVRQNLGEEAYLRFNADDCTGGCFVLDDTGKSATVRVPDLPAQQFFAGSTPAVSVGSVASWGPLTECVVCVRGDLTVGNGSVPGDLVVSGGDVEVGGDVTTAYTGTSSPAGKIQTPDGRTLYSGTWNSRVQTVPADGRVQVSSTTAPDLSAVTTTLGELIDDSSLKLATHVDNECAPESGTLLAYFDKYYRPGNCLSFAPGIYFLTGNYYNEEMRINGSTTGIAANGMTGALFYLTCGDWLGHPVSCSSGWYYDEPDLRTTTASGITVKALQGSPYAELNGYAFVTDPDNTVPQHLGGLTVEGDVYLSNARSTQLVQKGRLVADQLITGTGGTPALTISLTTSTVDGPVRLVR